MQTRSHTSASSMPRLSPAVWLIGGGVTLLYLVTNALGGYGYFNDEFYYIACAKRLAWGYVDHPPLAPLLLRLSMAVFGDSVLAIRLLSSLAGGLTVVLGGLLARRLGGGAFAQGLAALTTALTPLLLAVSGLYSMNAFEPLVWVGSLLVLVRILEGAVPTPGSFSVSFSESVCRTSTPPLCSPWRWRSPCCSRLPAAIVRHGGHGWRHSWQE